VRIHETSFVYVRPSVARKVALAAVAWFTLTTEREIERLWKEYHAEKSRLAKLPWWHRMIAPSPIRPDKEVGEFIQWTAISEVSNSGSLWNDKANELAAACEGDDAHEVAIGAQTWMVLTRWARSMEEHNRIQEAVDV
jgi:hypothetical protein